jgi:hypothetical protein
LTVAVAAIAVLAVACGKPPTSTGTLIGTGTHGTVADLSQDDNSYYTTDASCTGEFLGCTTDWYAEFDGLGANAKRSGLEIKYVGKNDGAGWQFVEVFNYETFTWYPVDAFHLVWGEEQTVQPTLPATGVWTSNKGIGFVRVVTVGALKSTSADQLRACFGDDCSDYATPIP